MRYKITALAVLMVAFMALAGMSGPSAGPGCDCNAHARTNAQTVK